MDQQDLNSQFWSANVSEICLRSDVFNVKIPVAAPSLRSLFFQKRILGMSGSDWTDSLSEEGKALGIDFDKDCYEIGFNVGGELPNPAARLGIVSRHDAGKHVYFRNSDSLSNIVARKQTSIRSQVAVKVIHLTLIPTHRLNVETDFKVSIKGSLSSLVKGQEKTWRSDFCHLMF